MYVCIYVVIYGISYTLFVVVAHSAVVYALPTALGAYVIIYEILHIV